MRTSEMFIALMVTMPASMRAAIRSARSTSALHTALPRPYSVSFAAATASSSPSTTMIAPAGPNVSSSPTACSRVTPVSSVGAKKKPGPSTRPPGTTTRAPASTLRVTWRSSSSRRSSRAIGPTVVAGSRGSPMTFAVSCAAIASVNASATVRSTMNRFAEMQLCPQLTSRASAAVRPARSTSASARTTYGSEPPSSRTVRFPFAPATAATARPPRVEPVNETPWMRTSAMTPAITSGSARSVCTTPSGIPASRTAATIASPVPIVFGALLSTSVFPPATTGAIMRIGCQYGKFHGMIARTVPIGS